MSEDYTRRQLLGTGARLAGGLVIASLGAIGKTARAQSRETDGLRKAAYDARADRPAEAEALFARLERITALTHDDCREIADIKRRLRKYREAVPYADRAVALWPAAGNMAVLIAAYAHAGRHAEARNRLARYLQARTWQREPGMTSGHVRDILDQPANMIAYRARTISLVLDAQVFPKDIIESYRRQGFWDIPISVDTPYRQCAVQLTNTASHTERIDTAGNRWWRIVPAETDKPIGVTFVLRTVPAAINLDQADSSAPVPDRLKFYTGKTPRVDPTTTRVQAIAPGLKGLNPRDTIERVWRWISENIEDASVNDSSPYATLGGNVNSSESTLARRSAACFGHATTMCALLRALGMAARPVWGARGDQGIKPEGHGWPEVWVPSIGWLELQHNVPVGWTDWSVVKFAAEPSDRTSWSPLLDWPDCDFNYISQFVQFYINNASVSQVNKLIGRSLNDINLDDAVRAAAAGRDMGDFLAT